MLALQYVRYLHPLDKITAVRLFWLLLCLVSGARLHTAISNNLHATDLPGFVIDCLWVGCTTVQFVVVWLEPGQTAYQELSTGNNECPSDQAGIFPTLTFGWMTPMMRYGYTRYITEDDLWYLAKTDTAVVSDTTFQNAWGYERKKKGGPSLWTALFRSFGSPYAVGIVFKVISDVLVIVQPQLMRELIAFVRSYHNPQPQPFSVGVAVAIGMFGVSVTQSLCLHQSFQRLARVGIKLKSSLVCAIYNKSLKLSSDVRVSKATGNVVNLMAVDCQRLQDATSYSQHLWSAPLQIVLCMVSLYDLLGYSMFVGVTVMLFTIPISARITRIMKGLQKQQMKNKDERSRLIAEVIANIKSIKLLAWGSAFAERIRDIRNNHELATQRKIGALQAISSFVGSVAPFLVACSAFAMRILVQGKPLTTEIAFPSIALFHALTYPLTILPSTISSITEASIAANRLVAFLTADEVQPDAVSHEEAVTEAEGESIIVDNATFTRGPHAIDTALDNITFSVRKGELCCLVGPVGSGKSSILGALLGELHKVSGTVTVRGTLAYAAQQAWVLNASVRDNITFGNPWDPDFYVETIKACALVDDLTQLPYGDQTQVGDKGISLSGGQKARLTLARAVYAKADIYLLDDCLSAVDQHVGRHLIDHVLGPEGLLRDKTKILATNSAPVLPIADSIVLICDGAVAEQGTYSELMNIQGAFANIIGRSNNFNEDGTRTPINGSLDPVSIVVLDA
jgi:ATP-binding cassette, subfamily C (CFTR/MRP), member 1